MTQDKLNDSKHSSLKPLTEDQIKKMRRSDVLTTGMVAGVCRVSARTVCKWCDEGVLLGYRIPGTAQFDMGDRRFRKTDVIKFLKENKMPLNELEDDTAYLKCFTDHYSMVKSIEDLLGGDVKVTKEPSVAMFIMDMMDTLPSIVLVDWSRGRNNCEVIMEAIDKLIYKPLVISIAVADVPNEVYKSLGSHEVFTWPDDQVALITTIARHHSKRIGINHKKENEPSQIQQQN